MEPPEFDSPDGYLPPWYGYLWRAAWLVFVLALVFGAWALASGEVGKAAYLLAIGGVDLLLVRQRARRGFRRR